MHAEPATDNSDCSYGVRPLRSPSILLQMLLRDRHTATVADALQAERWRDWLVDERSRLALELSKQESQYQRCAALAEHDRRGRYLRHCRPVLRE